MDGYKAEQNGITDDNVKPFLTVFVEHISDRRYTVTIQNNGEDLFNGIFYTIFIPNDINISEFTFNGEYERSKPNAVYEGTTANRFIFEFPQNFGSMPLDPNQKIIIDITTDKSLEIETVQWHIVGYIDIKQEAIFGYN